jgi:hypothetical protein
MDGFESNNVPYPIGIAIESKLIDGWKRRKAIGNRAKIDIQPTPYRTWYTL